MNINALRKIAEDNDSKGGDDPKSDNQKGSGAGGIIPLALGGGAGLLAHSIMAPEDKEEAKKESIWSKVLRWLTVAGAGVGTYYLAKGMAPTPASPKKLDKLEQEKDDVDGSATLKKYLGGGLQLVGWGGTGAAGAYTLGEPVWRRLRNQAGVTNVRAMGRRIVDNARRSWPAAALSSLLGGTGMLLGHLSKKDALKAKALEREIAKYN